MSLKNINPSPRLIKHLVASKAFDGQPLMVVDIGARRGFESHWSVYGDQVKMIGFEADAKECERLNQQAAGSGNRFFPVALHQSRGKRSFYITAQPSSSGFYPPNMRFVQRLPDEVNLSVIKTVEMDTVDFDSFASENGIDSIDFIKLDTEGCELDILQGAARSLKKVIGLSIEVEFLQLHEGQPVFGDIDSFLRPLGFMLYDLTIYRHSRKALPTASPTSGPVARGQVTWAEALYLRDVASEIDSSSLAKGGWDDIKVLKLASIMELFCLPDCAIELLQTAHRHGLLQGKDVAQLIDLLVPGIGRGKPLSYNEYIENVERIKRRGYASNIQRTKRLLPMPVRRIANVFLIKLRDSIDEILK
jgi:FkbM family methyltransferase